MTEDWLIIGKIVSPQGLKGEVRVLSYSDFPERFETSGKRWIAPSEKVEPQEREEPYLVLTSTESCRDAGVPQGTVRQVLHGCRQLVS